MYKNNVTFLHGARYMNKKLTTLLENLSREQLITLVKELAQSGKSEQKSVETCLATFDPKELNKLLSKKITLLKNSKRFIDYHKVPLMWLKPSMI